MRTPITDMIRNEMERGKLRIDPLNKDKWKDLLTDSRRSIVDMTGVPPSYMDVSPANTKAEIKMSKKLTQPHKGWNVHPKWKEIYRVAHKKNGLEYFCAIIWKEGTTKVLLKSTHESFIIPFQEAKESFHIKRAGDTEWETTEKFVHDNLWETDSYVNSQILKRK